MKKVIWFLLVFLTLWVVTLVTAHPLDVSNTTLTLYPRTVEGVTYLHPAELDRILVLSGGVDPSKLSVDMYYAMTGTLTQYLGETLTLENDGLECSIGNYRVMEGMMVDEIFRNGFPISYTITCPTDITTPIITINICTEVQLQTNRLYVYESILNASPVKRDYRVLNVHKNSQTIILNAPSTLIDTDHDGVPDEDEILYRTDPNKGDTDGDGYSDREEIDNSWNPLSAELSPGQIPYSQRIADDVPSVSSEATLQWTKHTLSQDTTLWGGERFSRILTDIRIYIDDHGDSRGFMILLISVLVLGFVHAIGPGHSKWILVSQILDADLSFMKWILYSLIFSIVHILDIIVVVVVSKYLLKLFDPGKYLWTIQFVSILLILLISTYLLITSTLRFWKRQSGEKTSKWQHIFLAIVSGITPCAFGWSIFLLLFAVRRVDLALPLLLALGSGIFLCLASITCVTFLLKDRIYSFSPRIGSFSPIISSLFLFCIGSFLFVQVI